MATRKSTQKDPSAAPQTTGDLVEKKLVALAGQLGFLIGTVQAKADGWIDRKGLSNRITRIRDSAADLLDHLGREAEVHRAAAVKQPPAPPVTTRTAAAKQPPAPSATPRPAAAKQAAAPAPPARAGRGAVDAPGKRHRKPPPQEPIDRRMGEATGKQMGQKSSQGGRRGLRGNR